ncbi:MAG: hybrid sensor histidine kinase/response regulator, partial [Polyangiales bacterium]
MKTDLDDDRSEIEILLAMVEHEVRTPLSALLGFADLLHADLEPQELAHLSDRIRANAGRLRDVIDGLRGVGESDAARPIRGDAPLGLGAVFESVAEQHQPEADAKGLRLHVDLDPRIPAAVEGTRGKLVVVLGNLIANAIKFTDRGRVLVKGECVATTACAVTVRYSVADTGRGIRADAHAEILRPFVRTEESATAPGDGLGLGICDKLLRTMGSRVEIESALGLGSTFSFEIVHGLPVGARTGKVEPHLRDAGPNPDPVRVLLVDDDHDTLEIMRPLVQREGFATDVAHDGHTALSMVERTTYAVVLTDLHMAGMDGIELSRRLRELATR